MDKGSDSYLFGSELPVQTGFIFNRAVQLLLVSSLARRCSAGEEQEQGAPSTDPGPSAWPQYCQCSHTHMLTHVHTHRL